MDIETQAFVHGRECFKTGDFVDYHVRFSSLATAADGLDGFREKSGYHDGRQWQWSQESCGVENWKVAWSHVLVASHASKLLCRDWRM